MTPGSTIYLKRCGLRDEHARDFEIAYRMLATTPTEWVRDAVKVVVGRCRITFQFRESDNCWTGSLGFEKGGEKLPYEEDTPLMVYGQPDLDGALQKVRDYLRP